MREGVSSGAGSSVRPDKPHNALIGRALEIAALTQLLAPGAERRALVLIGDAGIGKTTLWERGTELAADAGFRVLRARPSDAEVGHSFVTVRDLLDGVDVSGFPGIPPPQRAALDIALLRAAPEDAPPELSAISAGLLGVLRELSFRAPLLLAIDDLQWLDPDSAAALAFSLRRLRGSDVRVLLARRAGPRPRVERETEPGLRRVEVGALSLGASQQLLAERLDLVLPRRVSSQLVDAARGNPLFLQEIGRAVVERGVPEIGGDLPAPYLIDDLFGARVRALPTRVRHPLLAVALSDGLAPRQLDRVAQPDSVEAAVAAGLLVLDHDAVRASHPLLALAARKDASAPERRSLHRELANVVEDEIWRARHLALGTWGPDAATSAIVAAAASTATERGSTHDAIALYEEALRLTPTRSKARGDRLLALAEVLITGGEHRRVNALLGARVSELAAGSQRARGHLLLAAVAMDLTSDERHIELALAESNAGEAQRAAALARKAGLMSSIRVARVADAEAIAIEALDAGRAAGGVAEHDVAYALAWARLLSGGSLDDRRLQRPASEIGAGTGEAAGSRALAECSIERFAGMRLAFRGRVREARELLEAVLEVAEERGESSSRDVLLFHLCEIAVRVGDVPAASALLDEHEEWTDAPSSAARVRCRALLAAVRGHASDAVTLSERGLIAARDVGDEWSRLEATRARGIAALLAREPEISAERLRDVWMHTVREGVREPGVFPVAPDLVEALIALGCTEEAMAVSTHLRELAGSDHPWGLIAASRCEAMLRLSAGSDEASETALTTAASASRDLGLPFDEGRTLLSLGLAQRRLKKRGAARRSLRAAAEIFAELGCDGWAEAAHEELGRISARRPVADGELTMSESRVVELAAVGLANKEIAARLTVTVHTVEVHLSRAYAKLGVNSRRQLPRRLSRDHGAVKD